jgi:hypothetical protein
MDAWIEGLTRAFSNSKAPQHHVHIHPHDPSVADRVGRLEVLLGDLLRTNHSILEKVTSMAIDTSAALTAVRNLTGDNASLRELLNQVKQKVVDISQQLADAQAGGSGIDAATAAQIQTDLNTVADLANTEDAAVKAAIGANPAPAQAVNAGAGAQPVNTPANPS